MSYWMLTLCDSGLDKGKDTKLRKELSLPWGTCSLVEKTGRQLNHTGKHAIGYPSWAMKVLLSVWFWRKWGHCGMKKPRRQRGSFYSHSRRVLEARWHLDEGNGKRNSLLGPFELPSVWGSVRKCWVIVSKCDPSCCFESCLLVSRVLESLVTGTPLYRKDPWV